MQDLLAPPKRHSTDLKSRTLANVRWSYKAEYEAILFSERGLRLDEWLADGVTTIVKHGPHRVVYRVDLPELCFYVKHNLVPDLRSQIRQLIRSSKARIEFNRARIVSNRGIATIEPLAIGEQCSSLGTGESYLITEALANTMQLNDFIETQLPQLQGREYDLVRINLATELGKFIAELHNQGILHNDLHCGNILLDTHSPVKPKFYLIDLQAVHLRRRLNWQQCKNNLVVINRWLSVRAGRSDRLRFWHAYTQQIDLGILQQSKWLRGVKRSTLACEYGMRELARDLEEATRRSNQVFWKKREHRCLQNTRHNQSICTATVFGHASKSVDPELLQRLLQNPDFPFEDQQNQILKNSKSATVVEMHGAIDGVDRRLIYKRFGVTKLWDPVVSFLRPSPTARSWLCGNAMIERGLPTAKPLVMLHRRRRGLYAEGYLLMERVDTCGDVRSELGIIHALPEHLRRNELRARIEQLASLIRTLHERFLSHRDLKAANLMVESTHSSTEGATDRVPFPYPSGIRFVDLVGVARPAQVDNNRRIKNIARLHASFHSDPRITRSDKLRFLRTYMQWGLFGKHAWKSWWRKIERATQEKIRKNLKNRRPLA